MLSVHFKFPAPLQWKAANQPLEVVLVNAKTREKPAQADVLAQANRDRGGNVDERRRAKTPLPVIEPRRPGKDLADAQRRGEQLEGHQRRLLSQGQEGPPRAPVEKPPGEGADQPRPPPAGGGHADLSRDSMWAPARIAKAI